MRPRVFVRLLPSLLLATVACSKGGDPAASVDAGPLLLGRENLATVERDTIRTGPRIAGLLVARQEARLRAEVPGTVLAVEVDLGQTVKKGQLLGRLEDRSLRDALSSAQAAVRSANEEVALTKSQAKRTKTLLEAGALAPAEAERINAARAAASSRRAAALAQLAAISQQVEATTPTAPFDGVVSERSVNPGDVVAPGAPLFTVIDPSSMRLQGFVSSDALSLVKVGEPVHFTVRGYGERRFEGQIEQLAPAADRRTGQIAVLVAIPNPGSELIAGLFADGRVAAEDKDALVVPPAAIQGDGDNARVVVIRDGRTTSVPVKVGLEDPASERIEVQGELQEGERVVTGAGRSMPEKTAVQVEAEREGPAERRGYGGSGAEDGSDGGGR